MRVFLTTIGAAALIAAFASPAAAQMCTGDANGMCGANPPAVNSEAQSDAPMSGGECCQGGCACCKGMGSMGKPEADTPPRAM